LSEQHLNIVSFDVPFPPDYGGVIDVYYKIQALYNAGVKIHLHCFDYGRGSKKELSQFCADVTYYKRASSKILLFNKLPFIVVSRRSNALVENLLKNDYPILFEGLHSCYHLSEPALANRIKLVRTHNVEHEYYMALARVEANPFKKAYFTREVFKLRAFESILKHASHVLAISPNDTLHFKRHYGNAQYLPAFHAQSESRFVEDKERFAFYHGNLAVGENEKACLWLINEVFAKSEFKLIIAGNNPSIELTRAVNEHFNVELKENISTAQILHLVQKAWVNVLPTFQNTGIKLKLLFSLYNGGYCLVNSIMVKDTGLEEFCIIKDDPEEMANALEALMRLPFSASEYQARIIRLNEVFSNDINVQKIIRLLEK
jgi:glycosyltransferase involved in cell wall biosynthesis